MEVASQLTTKVLLDQHRGEKLRSQVHYNAQHHNMSNRIGASVAFAQRVCPSAQ